MVKKWMQAPLVFFPLKICWRMTRMLLQGQRLNVAEKKFQGLWKNRTDRQKNIRFPSEYGYYKYRFENQFFCLLVVFWASSWWKFNETFTSNISVNEKKCFLKEFSFFERFYELARPLMFQDEKTLKYLKNWKLETATNQKLQQTLFKAKHQDCF